MKKPVCNTCGKEMRVRKNKKLGDHFWGCKSWPSCKDTSPGSKNVELWDKTKGEWKSDDKEA